MLGCNAVILPSSKKGIRSGCSQPLYSERAKTEGFHKPLSDVSLARRAGVEVQMGGEPATIIAAVYESRGATSQLGLANPDGL